MGGWSGGVYSRFRNWVTDKANSINPQAALFDQEDDGFAAGLNNCITKDGLSKPTSAMDWNGQSLTGVLNLANTGTISFNGGKITGNVAGNLTLNTPTSGSSLTVNGFAGTNVAIFVSSTPSNSSAPDLQVNRAGSTANNIQQGPNIELFDTTNTTATALQNSGGQTELWQYNGTWIQLFRITTGLVQQIRDPNANMQPIGYRNIPLQQKNANYVPVQADNGTLINFGGTFNCTINGSVFNAGDCIVVATTFTGVVTLIQGAGMTLQFLGTTGTSGNRTCTGACWCTVYFISPTLAIVGGPGVS